ncbi:MAG: restriction endonuclease subunit S [Cyanobacteriota bacterium]|jgi:type I restriction enzyme S subunit
MIEDLKPYPQYKDSGLPWLGQVPAHWEIARSKRLFRQRKEFANPEDQQLSATQAYGVISQALYEKRTGYRVVKISMHLDKRKHVEAGDFVISMRSFQGGLERAWEAGAIRSSYVVLKPSAEVSAGYFQHLFKSNQYINALRATSDFIRDGQDLNFGNFCGVALPLIPLQEQTAIARFLAWATNRLDRAIRAKRRIIALLNEQKQAIIHRAVTRGLDPSVPLKDSGIPWLGEIPEHWEVHRAKHLFREIDERSTLGSEEMLSVSHMTGVTPRSQKSITMFKAASYAGHKLCQPGDLVVNTMWAWMGALGTSSYSGIISPAYAVYRPRQMAGICSSYIDCLLRSAPYIANIICQSTGLHTSRLRLYPEAFFRLPINLPPHQEQLLIVDSLKADTAGLNSTIFRLESEINLLREYRTCLIADVVTGKLDVREVAAGLPEEELQDQPDVAAGYDADKAEDDADSDLIDTVED